MTHTFDAEYWNGIWAGQQGVGLGASAPSRHLVSETADLEPGTALDAGCGAGAEALWLASRGWRVTGADIAGAALQRAATRAVELGLDGQVAWVRADLTAWEPSERFDLVTTHYAHPAMPQLDFYDRVAEWVAPGGTLLIVGHLLHGGGHGIPQEHEHEHERELPTSGDDLHDGTPPASASATAVTITARLDPEAWTIVTARETHLDTTEDGRPMRQDDVIVRAVRR